MLMALILSVAMASTAELRPMDIRQCRAGARSRTCLDPGTGGTGTPPPVFSILPESGSGSPVAAPESFCTAFASELTGSYICLNGDGTSVLGSGVTLTESGSITDAAPRLCPNGPDCSPIDAQAFDGIGAFTGNQAVPPAGNFSACALVRVRAVTTHPTEVLLRALSTYLQVDSAAVRWRVNGTFATIAIGAPAGRWVFACGTYRRVANGTSVGIAYADGTAGTTVSTMPLPNALDFPVAIGTQASTDAVDIGLALYTAKELSAATISAMTAHVFGGSIKTADGTGTVAFTRGSLAHCIAGDGSLIQARIDAPCLTTPPGFSVPVLRVEGTRTNALTQSEGLNTWTANHATITANAIAGPTGAITAERVVEDALSFEHGPLKTVAGLTAGADQAFSVFVKAGARHRFCLKLNYGYTFANLNLGTVSCPANGAVCRLEQYADGWHRISVVYPGSVPTISTVAVHVILNALDIASCTYTGDGVSDGYMWGAQAESASWPSSYIKTEGTATTRAATLATMALPAGIVNAQGCAGATVASLWNQTPGTSGRILGLGSGSERALGIGSTNSIFDISDGVLAGTLSVSDTTIGPVDAHSIWGGGEQWVESNSTSGAHVAYDGTIVASPLAIGSTSTGTSQHWGYIGNIRMGSATNACQ